MNLIMNNSQQIHGIAIALPVSMLLQVIPQTSLLTATQVYNITFYNP